MARGEGRTPSHRPQPPRPASALAGLHLPAPAPPRAPGPGGLPAPARLLPRRRPSSPAVPASRHQAGRSSPLPSSVPHLPLLHLPLLRPLRPWNPGAAGLALGLFSFPTPPPSLLPRGGGRGSGSPERRRRRRGPGELGRREEGGLGGRPGGGKRGESGEGPPTARPGPAPRPAPPPAGKRAPGGPCARERAWRGAGEPGRGEGGAQREAARSRVRREPRACGRRAEGRERRRLGEGRGLRAGPFGPHCCSDWKPKTGGATRGERRQ